MNRHPGAVRNEVADALVRAAERLFAEKGSDAVSLREINAAAGATNASAVQYHFGDRRGLVRAVLAKHEVEVEQRRHAMLDVYEHTTTPDVRALAAALVEPLAAELVCDGGLGYLQLLSDLYNRPNPTFDLTKPEDRAHSVHRWRAAAALALTPEALRLHRRFDALRFTVSELARRGRSGAKGHRLFTSQLIDLVGSLLMTPVSEETRRLLR